MVRHIHLEKALNKQIDNLLVITGDHTRKEKEAFRTQLAETKEPFVLLSTGKYIGEGFDEPRLNSLFLTTPFKWKGTLAQYVGRLHRIIEGKVDIYVHDYIDINITAFSRMFAKRLKGYATLGYTVFSKNEDDILYDENNYEQMLLNDLNNATDEVVFYINYANNNKIKYLVKQIKVDYTIYSMIELDKTNAIKMNVLNNIIIIDEKIIWYGGINPFIFKNEEQSIMRIIDKEYAKKLIDEINISND